MILNKIEFYFIPVLYWFGFVLIQNNIICFAFTYVLSEIVLCLVAQNFIENNTTIENNKTSRYWKSLQRVIELMFLGLFVEIFKIFCGNHLLGRKEKFST